MPAAQPLSLTGARARPGRTTRETPKVARLSEQLRRLFIAYTQGINKAYGRTGTLFEQPFHRKQVHSEAYFTRLVYYIHLNPQRHGLISDYREWTHSSYHSLLSQKPTLLERHQVQRWFGGPQQFEQYHQELHLLTELNELLLDE